MSSIDLSNPQVLKNWLIGQMKEGRGEFCYKEKVLVFRMKDGSEYIAPEEVLKEVEVVKKGTEEKLIETPEEPTPVGAVKKKKKRIEV